ncbi:MAG TPA: CocE/NonD family hydrolase [Ktedonobacterales bacterium]|nr:CocE/NonD family hydrolase [Ktedonobacterales bacterium]
MTSPALEASQPRYAARIVFDQRVPMRDGVTLSADIYYPAASSTGEAAPDTTLRWPAILTRTPYIKANPHMLEQGRWFAERGYVFVAMDVRGRGDSDGEFTPYFSEGRDGYDSIEWIAAQPWSDGAVGTIGGSYLGRIQWLTAMERPPHLRAMVVAVPPSDPFVETPTGLPSPMHLCWLHYTSGRQLQLMEAVDWERVYDHLPLLTMDEAAGRGVQRRWRDEIAHARLDDYWRPICYQDKFDQMDVPTLHISGWYDDEQIGTPLNFAGMTSHAATAEARRSQRLLMGPWGHAVNTTTKLGEVDFGSAALIDLRGEQLAWFDRWLLGVGAEQPVTPARIFIMGENVWRDEQEWPLARAISTRYHLRSAGRANSRFGDGALATAAPPADEASDSYRYDPARPTPFITEATSSQVGGPDDYAAVQRRDDLLVYRTEPLSEDIEVTGPISMELYAASSAPDTDFMAMLLDVAPSGFTQRLTDGMVRARFREGMANPSPITPGAVYRYTIDCWNTAHVFRAGHRIAAQIASAAFPKYDRNLNTGAELGVTSEMAVAEQTIYHDAERPSAIILPIIPRAQAD